MISADQRTTHGATKLREGEGETAEAKLILLRLSKEIMSLNFTVIRIYRAASLTL